MRKKKAKKFARAHEWAIMMIRGAKGARLGTVSAPTREAAIEQVMDEFDLAPADKKRLIAQAH